MPKENIERAIKRGTGEGKDGSSFEEVLYEGYAPNGVALIIEAVTENRNRTVAEIRHILSRSGGSMGDPGSTSWQFHRAAYFIFPGKETDYEKIFELAVEGGADDVTYEEGTYEIIGPVEVFKTLSDVLHEAGIKPEEAGLRMIPNQELDLDVQDTLQVLRTIEALEEHDDVQNVFSNLRVSEEAMAALGVD